ncbi:MAG TPA: thermonuclease family protein [Candidatus Saccharimonadales bacterium]|nr:thermonuclease family protein [Candidatus Saccharimonadales bacterium]
MSRRRAQRQIISLVVTLVIAGTGYYASRHQQQAAQLASTIPAGSYRVTEFVDGDTIAVDMNGHNEKIRMIGVDTPETHDPRKAVECFGQAAAAYTKQLIGSGPVRLEADALSTNRDRYDRLLRYVYTSDNKLVEAEVIKNGYGFAYVSFPFSKLDEFRQYEKEAREGNKGLWSGCQPYLDKDGHIHSNTAT